MAEALNLLGAWCAIPSCRGDSTSLQQMAGHVAAWCRDELGAAIVPEALDLATPLVHARIGRGATDTVLLYNMYDVMPADPEGWAVDPFRGGIVELPEFGPCFVARGAENNKGPLVGMLLVLRDLLRAGRLPYNIELLIEGEEECGSRTLRDYLARDPCPVGPARTALFPSFCEYGGGSPRLYLGFKGIVHGSIRCRGGEWGGPSAAIHASNAPWIANPAWRLVEALGALAEAPTGRLGAIEIDSEAALLVATLARQFDPAAELVFRRSRRFDVDLPADGLLRRVLDTASLNLSHLVAGAEGTTAVIPPDAAARFDLRLPPTMEPDAVLASLHAHLAAGNLGGIEIAVEDAYPGHRFARHSCGVDALIGSYEQAGAAPQIWPWAPGVAPAYAFARVAPAFLIGGLGRGGNAHGVNEFVTLAGFRRYRHSLAAWLEAIGTELARTSSAGPTLPDSTGVD